MPDTIRLVSAPDPDTGADTVHDAACPAVDGESAAAQAGVPFGSIRSLAAMRPDLAFHDCLDGATP